MKGIREIKARIKSVKNTAQITRAMQLVAASKMQQAQRNAKASRPYSLLLAEILGSLVDHLEEVEHPFFEQRIVRHRGILVISTDKGLCGALNSNLFRLVSGIEPSAKFVAIGKKATQYLARTGRKLMAQFAVSDHCGFSEIRLIVELMIRSYIEGKIDTIEVVFPKFKNTLVQEATLEHLLPLTCLKEELEALRSRLGVQGKDEIHEDSREMHFEPGSAALIAELPELYIKQEIYQMVLEAKASEHSARMVAMKSATDNAKNLVDSLTLEYNKARQAAITQEILELAASSDAAA